MKTITKIKLCRLTAKTPQTQGNSTEEPPHLGFSTAKPITRESNLNSKINQNILIQKYTSTYIRVNF